MISRDSDFKRAAGVESLPPSLDVVTPPAHDSQGGGENARPGQSLVSRPPEHDRLPWACVTCGGWVSHVERVYTDEGLFHDRVSCLTESRFEELVAKYGCKCEEFKEDLSYWEMDEDVFRP